MRVRGQPVILLHGNPVSIEINWVETGVVDGLVDNFRVIALDLRGFGRSDKPHDPSAYGSNMADDVFRLMDHLNIERAHMVGYSMGARLASWMIVNHPERLSTVTLAASTYWSDSPELRASLEAAAAQWDSGTPYDRASLISGNPGITEEEADAFIKRRMALNDAAAVAAVYRGFSEIFVTEAELSQATLPVLHVVGSLDVTRLPASDRLVEVVLPATEFRLVEGATHSGSPGLYGRPELVAAITNFIRSN